MKHLLLDLPPHLLGQILSFYDVSHKSRDLWLCGSKILQSRLSQCVQTVTLKDGRSIVMRRLPSYLANLNSLRVLEVDTLDNPIYYEREATVILNRLQERLERLAFRVQNWYNILPLFEPDTGSEESLYTSDLKSFGIGKNFLALAFLELPTHSGAVKIVSLRLPPNLTEMTTAHPYEDEFFQMGDSLPKSLTRWNMSAFSRNDVFANFLSCLPSRIMELCCVLDSDIAYQQSRYNYAFDVSIIRGTDQPLPSLKKAEKVSRPQSAFHATTQPVCIESNPGRIYLHTPSFHEVIEHLSSPGLFTSIHFQQTKTSRWDAPAPPSTLTIPDLLPFTSLTHLRGCVDMEKGASIAEWPRTLSSLYLELIDDSTPLPSQFPSSITRLAIDSNEKCPLTLSIFNRLPRCLKYFKADTLLLNDDDISFPPFLTTLKLTGTVTCKAVPEGEVDEQESLLKEEKDYFLFDLSNNDSFFTPKVLRVTECFPFEKLPATLRHLRLFKGQLPLSKLANLPPCLQSLHASFLKDADFDVQDPAWIERIRFLHQQALTDGVPESHQNSRLPVLNSVSDGSSPSVRVLDLLPRTLTDFRLESSPEVDGWDGLPLLRCLHIESYELLDGDVLFHIPMKLLTELTIKTVQNVTNEHIKALGRSIRKMDLDVFTWSVTEDAWRFWPPEDTSMLNMPSDTRDRRTRWIARVKNSLRYPDDGALFRRAMADLNVGAAAEG